MFKAEIIADSLHPEGDRLTTFVVTFPRIILAELNTHRAFSRNSASSRAIPFKKMVEAVRYTPFIPMAWMKDHPGMQGTEFFTAEEVEHGEFIGQWLAARDAALEAAIALHEGITIAAGIDSGDSPSSEKQINVSKQVCNRLLEPFMWHTAIITSSRPGLENFFALRAHPAAEIHMQKLAEVMLDAYNKSTPINLGYGNWHLPYDGGFAHLLREIVYESNADSMLTDAQLDYRITELKLKVAVARCARVSYTVIDGDNHPDTIEQYRKDIQLHDRLKDSGHWSPFEHVAKCVNATSETTDKMLFNSMLRWRGGNFDPGWAQYRKYFPNECKKDGRVSR